MRCCCRCCRRCRRRRRCCRRRRRRRRRCCCCCCRCCCCCCRCCYCRRCCRCCYCRYCRCRRCRRRRHSVVSDGPSTPLSPRRCVSLCRRGLRAGVLQHLAEQFVERDAPAALHLEPVVTGEQLGVHEEGQWEEEVARSPPRHRPAAPAATPRRLVVEQRVVDAVLKLLHQLVVLHVHVCKQHIGGTL